MRLFNSSPSIVFPFQVRPPYVGRPLMVNFSPSMPTAVFRLGASEAAAAENVRQASETLETQSLQLSSQVTEFLGKIRAA